MAIVLSALLFCLTAAMRPAYADIEKTVTRLGGDNRYQTMAKIVSTGFTTSDSVVVATGQNFPDALSASALAGALDCPVVLTSAQSLSPEASAEISRLGAKTAYLMGGTGALSQAVESQIKALGLSNVTRIAGADRIATSIEALSAVREAGSTSDTVILATGKGFADALSIGPWSYQTASPIVLVGNDGTITNAAIAAIRADAAIKKVLIVGGTSAVADDVAARLGGNYSIERLQGADRYATSTAIANWEVAHGLNWKFFAVATGQNFPDALAGAAFCGAKSAPILLTTKNSLNVMNAVVQNRVNMGACYILGGASAVSYAQLVQTKYLLNTPNKAKFPFEELSKLMLANGTYTAEGKLCVSDNYILKTPDGKKLLLFVKKPHIHDFYLVDIQGDKNVFDYYNAGDTFGVYTVVSKGTDGSIILHIDDVVGNLEFREYDTNKDKVAWTTGLVNGSEIETVWKAIADYILGADGI